MQEGNITIRLKFLIQELGITSSEFAENCGISRATLSQLLTGRNKKISDKIIGQIHSAYPSLSILWLLFNEGEMWIGDSPIKNNIENADTENDTKTSMVSSASDYENIGLASSDPINASKNPSEITKFPTSGHTCQENGKENGLNCTENIIQTPNSMPINNCLNSIELINEIENLRKKIRKVVQITVYFDDSTFETFYPGRK